MGALIDLTGKRFGRLLVIRRADATGRPTWLCQCDCGRSHQVKSNVLISGDSTSCGCFKREQFTATQRRTTHGCRYTTEYKIWDGIKQRCLNSNDKAYPMYGGRGITICERWLQSFDNFLSDIGPRPDADHTIDRIDNDGPYSPDNCRWATWHEQNNNQRSNRLLEYNGRTLTMAQWARVLGINYKTFKWAIHRGETVQQVVERKSIVGVF